MTVPKPNDLKIRPVVAGPSSVTSRLSNYLDVLLKPLLRNVTSHVCDTVDFLNNIPDRVGKKIILATFDTSSMYTKIDNDLGPIRGNQILAGKRSWHDFKQNIKGIHN